MIEQIRNCFKIKDLRNRILYTLVALVVVRIGCQLPLPGVDSSFIQDWFEQQDAMDFFNQLTGGSFAQMSIFALNITPYITASIIIQLLTIAIPRLEELHKDGESGRRKMTEYTRYLSVVLSVVEAVAMAIGFGQQGYLTDGLTFTSVMICIVSLTAGATYLMWLGEQITEHGIGNGISIILLYNIVSRMPSDMQTLFEKFVAGASNVTNQLIGAILIIVIIVGTVVLIVYLSDGERRIAVQYSNKTQGRRVIGGKSSHIPLKINTAGVIPIIFAGSLFQMPIVIAQFAGVQPGTGIHATTFQKFLTYLNQNAWFNINSASQFKYTIGFVVYVALIIFFAYFYTAITFNPAEISSNMKKSGGFIPGIRPGKPTTDYLTNVLNNIIMIGAIGLSIVTFIPIFFSGAFGADVSFGGTSLIIIVGVVLETLKQIQSRMVVRHYKGFVS
ncbi:MAG: preprotein translocase subunit SecY [Lachnospiraceae bacterium]|nr:preprotein translocase subunit SecY [Lachnospiraceae bacterium]MEE3461183.1 preprotein translocase subunit SecY [Lachnospiraceae bacterium]